MRLDEGSGSDVMEMLVEEEVFVEDVEEEESVEMSETEIVEAVSIYCL